jgi:hypothetical protein
MFDQKRTIEVVKWLKSGLDRKLQSGVQPRALEYLEKAYALARDPPRLEAPWPQITAYRLAHLKMREGTRTKWDEVDKLLQEATEEDILGPAPLVYRLIALWKRRPESASNRELEELYAKTQRLISQTRPGDKSSIPYPGDSRRTLQPDWLNLLEIAVYATELRYEPITGWVNVDKDPFAGLGFESSAWIVLEDGVHTTIQYPEAIARQRFEQRCQQLGDCIAVEFTGPRSVAVRKHQAGKLLSGTLTERLCLSLKSLITESKEHLKTDPDSDDPRGECRQRKSRLHKALRDLIPQLDRDAFSAWWDDPRQETRPICLPPILMLGRINHLQPKRRDPVNDPRS